MNLTPQQIEQQQKDMLQSAINREQQKRKSGEKITLLGLILGIGLALLAGTIWVKCNQSDSPIKPETIECK